ncbi:MAG: tetratricopeptide repeat protein [bacterium]
MKRFQGIILFTVVLTLAVVVVRMTFRVRELERQRAVTSPASAAGSNAAAKPKTSTPVASARGVPVAPADAQPKPVSVAKPVQAMAPVSVVTFQGDSKKLIADARAAMGRKAYDKAVELLRQALAAEADPEGKQQIREMLAESLAATQDFDGAVALYREYLSAATSDQERVLGVTREAAVLSLAKRFDEAEAVLAQPGLIGDDPAMRQAIQNAQLRLWQAQPGRLDQVAAELESKAATDPSDRDALELLGTIYLKVQRKHDKAKPVYEKLLALDPNNAGIQNTLIGIYRETRDYAKARDIYERYLAAHPNEADGIRFQIASLYIQSGQGDEAVAYAEKYLNGADATAERKEQVARIYEFSGRLDDAAKTLKDAETAAQDAAKKTDLRFRQSDLLIRQQKYADAEALVRSILAESGADKASKARANQELIRVYQVQGKVGELSL